MWRFRYNVPIQALLKSVTLASEKIIEQVPEKVKSYCRKRIGTTNLLLAWLLQVAVLGDYYAPTTQRRVALVAGAASLVYVLWRIAVGPGSSSVYAISLGDFGGFKVGETLLILDSLPVVGLLYPRHSFVPARARRFDTHRA